MKKHKFYQNNLVAFVCGELNSGDEKDVRSHLENCSHCRRETEELGRIVEISESFKPGLSEAVAAVDWEALPGKIAETVFHKEKPVRSFFLPKWRPVFAALLIGLVLGSLVTFFAVRNPDAGGSEGREFVVTNEFFERVEVEMARRETLDYLEKSQFLLLDFVQASPDQFEEIFQSDLTSSQARSLLAQKKYINPQLEKLRMAKAKDICDQIEFLFFELTQVSDQLSTEDLIRIQNLIEEKQLLLRINLIKRDLERSDV